ncbi:MAG: 4-hydroxythreonine-4-phosphate dehydrogenase PdxA [Ignavibacteria bacterium]
MPYKPKIVISCGDPNGIGPEIALKLLTNEKLRTDFNLKLIIPESAVEYYSHSLRLETPSYEDIILIPGNNLKIKPGKIDKRAGRISGDAVHIGTELCLNGMFDALVTMPVSKYSLSLAGFKYTGHTELLKALTNSREVVMVMYSEKLAVVPLTIHIPVNSVSSALTKKLIVTKLELMDDTFKTKFGIRKPRIAVLSLNPHCGDGGIIGSEEINTLVPALDSLMRKGIAVSGPYSADGFFGSGIYRHFDVVAGAYHDQVLIPFKMLSGKNGVNYTAGLPIIRTSPSHGTAFDIAGKGIADTGSAVAAVKLAGKLINGK